MEASIADDDVRPISPIQPRLTTAEEVLCRRAMSIPMARLSAEPPVALHIGTLPGAFELV